jgi:integrase
LESLRIGLGIEDVRAYQLHLIAQKRSWSHMNQTACALRFFYGVTLGRQEAFERIVNGREPERLPPVLTPEEVARFLEAVAGLRNGVALTTAYAAGLRIGEVCRLKAASIDSKRMLIHVEGGKGAKDRYGMLSPRLLDILRAYWQRALVEWRLPRYNTIHRLLTNPVYAGAYLFGRTGSHASVDAGRKRVKRGRRREPEQWETTTKGTSPGRTIGATGGSLPGTPI